MAKQYSTHEKIMLFDLENFKRKVRENSAKYDKRNNLIPLIEQARRDDKDEIVLFRVDFYSADICLLEYLDCYYEFEHLGSYGWNYHIFLTKESHEKYLARVKENLIESLGAFEKMVFL